MRTRNLPILSRRACPELVERGGLSVAQDVSPGLGKERCLVPKGRLNPFPALSAVPAGLVELSDLFPGLTSWATLNRPFGTPVVFFRNLLVS